MEKMNIDKALELLNKDGGIPEGDYKSICENSKGAGGPCSACGAC